MSTRKPISLDGLLPSGSIAEAVVRTELCDPGGEVEAWSGTTMEQRWDALTELRERTAKWRYACVPRLERVIAVVQMSELTQSENTRRPDAALKNKE